MKVVLRRLSEINSQVGYSTGAVIECNLVPGMKQTEGLLAAGLTPREGFGLYYLNIGKNTKTTTWVEGELIDVIPENGLFVSEKGAAYENVMNKKEAVLSGMLNSELQLKNAVYLKALNAGNITQKEYDELKSTLFKESLAKAEAKMEAKAEERRVANPVVSRRDRRNNVDLSAFGITTPEGLKKSNPEKATA